MTTVGQIFRAMEEIAPFHLSDSFDNTGLLVGSAEAPVKRVLLTLDITNDVIAEAKAGEMDLIISHHPVIFHALKSLRADDPAGALLVAGIGAICAHTNLDQVQGGISDQMAERMGLTVTSVLTPTSEVSTIGYGRICEVEAPMTAAELAKRAKEAFGCTVVRYVEGNRPIRTIALNSGGGTGSISDVYAKGIDAFVTGDIKHDQWITAANEGLTLIDAGHFHTEAIFVNPLQKQLEERFPDVEFLISRGNTDPCSYVI